MGPQFLQRVVEGDGAYGPIGFEGVGDRETGADQNGAGNIPQHPRRAQVVAWLHGRLRHLHIAQIAGHQCILHGDAQLHVVHVLRSCNGWRRQKLSARCRALCAPWGLIGAKCTTPPGRNWAR